MAMQDKFAVGPVTFVQLVGLSAKPKIPSVQADGAARAADHPPPSAAAGFGLKLPDPVPVIESSYFDAKTAPTLGLSADLLQGSISFDSAVDRPTSGGKAATPQPDPSPFDPPFDATDPVDSPDGRIDPVAPGKNPQEVIENEPIVPATVPTEADNADNGVGAAQTKFASSDAGATTQTNELQYVFDGAVEFGDDEILDFAFAADHPLLTQAAAYEVSLSGGDIDMLIDLQPNLAGDWGVFDIIDCSGGHSSEPTLMSFDDFVAPQHQVSITDGVLSI